MTPNIYKPGSALRNDGPQVAPSGSVDFCQEFHKVSTAEGGEVTPHPPCASSTIKA